MLGLRARRPSVWRAGAAGGDVLLLARSVWRAPAGTSGGVCRDLSSRCLWRLHQAVRGQPQAGSIGRGGVLGPCPPAVFILADVAANARRKAQGKTTGPISPLALEAVHRIDALFDIERSINGQSAEQR